MTKQYKPAFENQFKKHYKQMLKQPKYNKNQFNEIYYLLINDEEIPAKFNDHNLINRKPERELHIKPDWLLIYRYDGDYIKFIDTGSHSDLFE
ncbi:MULTISPECIES: type II toxin-antitoxin system YafQ family toxin [Fructilactobacillus]|uniref:Type II toxin-antitoxin system YafQ family toxin n=2 Tax=Fructilactobacillus TaxID=2767881 RepID=A0A9Q9E2P6_9LACO|nr:MULTISPECIES: type II toxin-antitoxin system YafQ family toxin [Fructilactobacillus]USS85891.1 type II toxin-antitoxin system YafQ family toxin [Fructilactobacillus cliffordii]USS88972.1 type II toxin-antitoxin system YafQ family toxin [Fructilactobacillus cliffordii]USS90376.1 type II toxin-antitoxin system YafQ family toxin [Fructilactobacillus carniphilus]